MEKLCLLDNKLNMQNEELSSKIIGSIFNETDKDETDQIKKFNIEVIHSFVKNSVEDFVLSEYALFYMQERSKDLDLSKNSTVSEEIMVTVRNEFNRLEPEYNIHIPEPEMKIPCYKWIYPAVLGAVLGTMFFPRFFQMFWGNIEVGKAVGGALGSFLIMSLTIFIVNNKKIFRYAQLLLGLGAVTVAGGIILENVSAATPWGQMFGSIKSIFSSKKESISTKFKVLFGIIFSMIFLYVMRPTPFYNIKNLKRSILKQNEIIFYYSIKIVESIINKELSLFELKNNNERREITTKTDDSSVVLKVSDLFEKLESSISQDDTAGAQKIISSIKVLLGRFSYIKLYEEDGKPFQKEMEEKFDILGVIEVGQPIQVMEPAIIENKKIIKKGLLQRKRG